MRPVLTEDQEKELEEVHSEEILQRALGTILDEVAPFTSIGRRAGDVVEMSDRQYQVQRDGSLRRLA